MISEDRLIEMWLAVERRYPMRGIPKWVVAFGRDVESEVKRADSGATTKTKRREAR